MQYSNRATYRQGASYLSPKYLKLHLQSPSRSNLIAKTSHELHSAVQCQTMWEKVRRSEIRPRRNLDFDFSVHGKLGKEILFCYGYSPQLFSATFSRFPIKRTPRTETILSNVFNYFIFRTDIPCSTISRFTEEKTTFLRKIKLFVVVDPLSHEPNETQYSRWLLRWLGEYCAINNTIGRKSSRRTTIAFQ